MPMAPPSGHVVGGGMTPVTPSTVGYIPYIFNLIPPQTKDSPLHLVGSAVVIATDPDAAATETFRTQGGIMSMIPSVVDSVGLGHENTVTGPANFTLGAVVLGRNNALTAGSVSNKPPTIVGANNIVSGNSICRDVVVVGDTNILRSTGNNLFFGVMIGTANTCSVAGAVSGLVLIGSQCTNAAGNGTQVGNASDIGTGAANVVIGGGAQVTGAGANNVVIGESTAETGGSQNVVIGTNATATPSTSVVIGYSADVLAGHTHSIVIGNVAQSFAANCCVIGSQSSPITVMVVGGGNTVTAPSDLTIRASNSQNNNVAGSNLTIQAGLATGNAASGVINFQTSAGAGGSGTTLQTAATRFQVNNTGVAINGGTTITVLGRAVVNNTPTAVAAGISQVKTFPVTGVAAGDLVWCSPPGDLPSGLVIAAVLATAADTVRVEFYNGTGGSLTPTAGDWVFGWMRS